MRLAFSFSSFGSWLLSACTKVLLIENKRLQFWLAKEKGNLQERDYNLLTNLGFTVVTCTWPFMRDWFRAGHVTAWGQSEVFL